MRKLLLLALIVPAAACSTTPGATPLESPPPQVADAEPTGTCSSSGLERFVGQTATPETEAEMKAASGAKVVRMVGPDMAVTMDHRPDRLQVNLDRNGRVQSARCG